MKNEDISSCVYALIQLLISTSSGHECNQCCDLDCGENGDCDLMNGITSQPFCNCKNGYTTGNSGKHCDVKVTSPPLPVPDGKRIIVYMFSSSLSFLVRP